MSAEPCEIMTAHERLKFVVPQEYDEKMQETLQAVF